MGGHTSSSGAHCRKALITARAPIGGTKIGRPRPAAPNAASRSRRRSTETDQADRVKKPIAHGVYGATKAYVLALSHSLQHELVDKGICIQAVLPGTTASEIWEIAGLPYQNLPAEIVMSPDDVVDAALVGLDRGELVTIPPLHDGDEWIRFEAARRAISQQFGNSVPAPRYRTGAPA